MSPGPELSSRREAVAARLPEAIAMVALGSFALLLSLQAVLDNDIWWHLATGRWIIEHRALPQTDPFSTGGEHKPWVAYAWLFELLVWWLHQRLGLLGIVAYRAVFGVAIALATWRLVHKREPRVAVAALITLVALAAMRPVLTERSWLFTALFFACSLDAIVDLREGRPRSPWPLSVGYALWASTHIQFVYGLFAIGAGSLATVLDLRRGLPIDPRAPRRLALLGGCCALATLANPYGLRLWLTAVNLGRDTAAFDFVTELQAPTFHNPWHWAELAMLLAAAFALGRRARLPVFEPVLLATGAVLAFRAERDGWFMILVAASILAQVRPSLPVLPPSGVRKAGLILAACLLLVLDLAAGTHLSNARLQAQVAQHFPVAAAEAIRARGLTGALYNTFNWGGFATWQLPGLTVAVDGRTNLFSSGELLLNDRTWEGVLPPEARDPGLAHAKVVLGDKGYALALELRSDPHFALVYEDDLAAVFVAR